MLTLLVLISRFNPSVIKTDKNPFGENDGVKSIYVTVVDNYIVTGCHGLVVKQ